MKTLKTILLSLHRENMAGMLLSFLFHMFSILLFVKIPYQYFSEQTKALNQQKKIFKKIDMTWNPDFYLDNSLFLKNYQSEQNSLKQTTETPHTNTDQTTEESETLLQEENTQPPLNPSSSFEDNRETPTLAELESLRTIQNLKDTKTINITEKIIHQNSSAQYNQSLSKKKNPHLQILFRFLKEEWILPFHLRNHPYLYLDVVFYLNDKNIIDRYMILTEEEKKNSLLYDDFEANVSVIAEKIKKQKFIIHPFSKKEIKVRFSSVVL